jgi:hypothetical protein
MTLPFWKLLIIGWIVLIAAIVANGLTTKLGLKSWYDFIKLLSQQGSKAFSMLHLADYVWLFVLYPLILGSAAFLALKLVKDF